MLTKLHKYKRIKSINTFSIILNNLLNTCVDDDGLDTLPPLPEAWPLPKNSSLRHVKSVTHLFSDLEPTNYPEFEGDAIGLFTKLIPSREDKRVISEMTMALQLMKTQFQFTHSEMSAIVNMCRMTHNATELRHHLPSTSLGISSKWSDLQDYYCGDNDPVLTNIVCPRVDCKRLQSNSSARTCDSCGDILRKTSDIPLETIARVPLIFLLKLQLEDP